MLYKVLKQGVLILKVEMSLQLSYTADNSYRSVAPQLAIELYSR